MISNNKINFRKCLEILRRRVSFGMSLLEINEAAIMVLREHLDTREYDEDFFENVEKLLSIFNGENLEDSPKEEKTERIDVLRSNPFKNYKI